MKLFIQGDSEKPKLDPKVFEFRPKRNAGRGCGSTYIRNDKL